MNSLSEQVARGMDWLIKESLELDSWIRLRIHEEELLAWHLGEVLYDLRGTEMRMTEMVECRDRAAVLDALNEHCSDILDYVVPHWPLHVGPLRERVASCCGGADRGHEALDASGDHKEVSARVSSESDAMAGINALRATLHAFTMRFTEEGIADSTVAQILLDFSADIRMLHEKFSSILPLRRVEALRVALFVFCEDIDTMLTRWHAETTRLRSWLDSNESKNEHIRES